jgi:predicted secreted protein
MHLTRRFRRRFVLLTIAVAGSAWAASLADAEEGLRWKFTKGEKLDYVITQNMDMAMNAGPQGQMNMKMNQTIDMTWQIDKVDENGNATILQSIDRVQMKMTGPQTMEYDSQSEDAPVGLAAMIAPTFDAMTKGKFVVTMTPWGEVTDVQIPQEMVDALKNGPAAPAMGDMASADGFKQMISQGTLVLPKEMPAVGSQWTSTMEMKNPMAGQQKVETTYTYEGMKDVGGTTYAAFKPELKMTIAGQGQMQMTVKDQKSDGEILFNPEAGRIHSSKLNQDMVMTMKMGDQAFEQKIHQVVDVQVTPAQ